LKQKKCAGTKERVPNKRPIKRKQPPDCEKSMGEKKSHKERQAEPNMAPKGCTIGPTKPTNESLGEGGGEGEPGAYIGDRWQKEKKRGGFQGRRASNWKECSNRNQKGDGLKVISKGNKHTNVRS